MHRLLFSAVVTTLAFLPACLSSPSPAIGPDGEPAIDAVGPDGTETTDADDAPSPPRVILFIGDGMGPVHEDVASRFAHGETGRLSWHAMVVSGQLVTDSLSGVTDSAAASTAMATGELTINGYVGVGADGLPRETLVERARARGIATGVVTTTALPHATPAGFTAHQIDRNELRRIAEDQARVTRPEVMLGGGQLYFAAVGGEPSLFAELTSAGYDAIYDAASLAALDTDAGRPVIGSFSVIHLPLVANRGPAVPTLEAMTAAAIDVLGGDPDGFLLVVEAGRIDHASHDGDIDGALGETLELDRAVALAMAWSQTHDNVTLIVTADHETGGLVANAPTGAGEPPMVTWSSPDHTSAPVNVAASGPQSLSLAGQGDARDVHGVIERALGL